MNILVYGAGVIGSVYAARLQKAGYNVSLLARGQRALALRTQGVVLEDASTGRRTTTQVAIVDHLDAMDKYDVVIVTVRMDHLESVLPTLAANHQIPTVLFLINNPTGMQGLKMLEPHRVILGFPSVGGAKRGDVVRYMSPRQVATTLGKEEGRVTPRLQQIATAFKKAGFSVALSPDMQAWLKTHAIMASCLLAAVVMTNGASAQLGRTRKNVAMMVQAMREGLLALQAQNIPIMPFSMKVLSVWMPRWLTVTLMQYILRTPMMALDIDAQLDNAVSEAQQVAKEVMAQLQTSPRSTPTMSRLLAYLETPA